MVNWLFLLAATAVAADWPMFRGPNASGVSTETNLPVTFGQGTNMVWRTALAPGNSSPAIARDRIYVTAVEGEQLYTIAMDRGSGRVLWRRQAPRPRKQVIERPANGPVSATPATDGRNVWAFFPDFGLLAYGPDGNELWRMPVGPINNPFGHGASPVVDGNTVLMNIDQDTGSFLVALDKNTGKQLWRKDRPHAQRGYATPVLHTAADGTREVLVAGSFRLSGYELRTGEERWFIRRLPWQVKPTPVIADGVVYFTTFSAESNPGEQEIVPPFEEALAKLDTSKDGKLSKDEIVDERAKKRFEEYLDLDNSGFLEQRDWEQFRERRLGESALRAYRLGGKGDITESGFLWKTSKFLPNVPSPLVYQNVLYLLKEGGILTSFDTKTGEILKQARLQGAPGDYFASPVGADGKVYTVSDEGKVAVLRAGGQWEQMTVNDMKEGAKATPAFAGGRMYLRTTDALYCFEKKDGTQ